MGPQTAMVALVGACLAGVRATDCSGGGGTGEDQLVYVVRHGEKNREGNHLNSLGRERAQYLSGLWGKEGERFGAPKAVFANLFHEEWNSVELARPLAEKLGLPVISRYNRGNNTEAAEAISRKLHQTGGPIFVAWEHKNIVNLVRAIGCSCPWMENWAGEMWPKTDFDEIFILSMQGGTCISLDLQQEGFDGLQPWKDFLEPLVPCSLVLSLAAMVVWLRLKSNDFPFSASSRDVTPVSSASFLKTSSEPFLKTSGMC